MWLLPSNHPLYSAYAQECVDSKEALSELSGQSMSLPSWRWKPSSLQTYLQAWKRVYWIPRLFGRMLKPSMHSHFEERYTSYLVDIPVSLSHKMESEKEVQIQDTFTLLYLKQSGLSNHQSASLKMLKDTLHADSMLFAKIYKAWVTVLKQEYIQRRKLAQATQEKDSSSSLWPTPTAAEGGKIGNQANYGQVCLSNHPAIRGGVTREEKKKSRLNDGQRVQEPTNTTGNNQGPLNPAWVCQLMGTTLETIFYMPLVTQLWNKQQK